MDEVVLATSSQDNAVHVWCVSAGFWCATGVFLPTFSFAQGPGHRRPAGELQEQPVCTELCDPGGQLRLRRRCACAVPGCCHCPLCLTPVCGLRPAAQAGGGGLHLWSWGREQPCVRCFPAEALCCLAASPDGALLAGGSPGGCLTLWLVSTGQVLRTWQGHHKGVASLAFSQDAAWLVSGGQDTAVCGWLTPTGARGGDAP